MRTYLNDIKLIEQYLHKTLAPEDRLIVEVRMLVDQEFKKNVLLQQQVLSLVAIYYTQNLREELDHYTRKLFNDPLKKDFQNRIMNLFKEHNL
jgi:hypothetical protein